MRFFGRKTFMSNTQYQDFCHPNLYVFAADPNKSSNFVEGDLDECETINAALSEAHDLMAEISNYCAKAADINDEFIRTTSSPNPCLDDFPFGEELLRTEPLLDLLETAISKLEIVSSHELPARVAEKLANEADDIICEARSTLEQCRSLPSTTGYPTEISVKED